MLLTQLHVRRYRSVEDSDAFEIDPDVTCLVGKNESGKTAVLQATYRVNPVVKTSFDEIKDYPSRLTSERKQSDGYVPVTTATFELSDGQVAEIEGDLGADVVTSRTITLTVGYRGVGTYQGLPLDESVAIAHLTSALELPAAQLESARKCKTIPTLVAALAGVAEPTASSTALHARLAAWRSKALISYVVDTYLSGYRPTFVYFDDYDSMPGKVSIPDLIRRRDAETITRGEQAIVSLLSMVDVDLEDFLKPENHEHLIREAENASNTISDEVFRFWSQNKSLSVQLKLLEPELGAPAPLHEGPILQVRVYNERHRVSVPFDERSRGFVWFFSFLAYFSEIEREADSDDRPLVLLLDEPGLSLHATAQRDLLKLIDERLAPKHQVIYSTHSPFLVDPHRLDRVRTVVDVDKVGTKVSADVHRADSETAFPLQAALGYEMSQTLFVGPHNLLLEGPSDLIYLDVLSDACASTARTSLDLRWVKVPVGGSGKLSTFVSLLGANQLDVAVVMDASTSDAQAIKALRDAGRLAAGAVITIGDVIGQPNADIEDMFTEDFYVELVNRAHANQLKSPIKTKDLKDQNPRIVRRVDTLFGDLGLGKLNHYSPAAVLLRVQAKPLPQIDDSTLDHAAQLFERLNALLS